MFGLAVETSSLQGSLCLFSYNENKPDSFCPLSHKVWRREKSHSEIVTHELEILLNEHHLSTKKLNHLCVGIGPGSFTGLRVGINLVRALSYAHNIPVAALNSLEVLAGPVQSEKKPIVCLVNAFKNLIYTTQYNVPESSLKNPQALTLNELDQLIQKPHLCLGDGFKAYEKDFSPRLKSNLIRSSHFEDYPLAQVLGQMVVQNFQKIHLLSWKEVKPLYIRSSGAEEKLKSNVLKSQ